MDASEVCKGILSAETPAVTGATLALFSRPLAITRPAVAEECARSKLVNSLVMAIRNLSNFIYRQHQLREAPWSNSSGSLHSSRQRR